MIILDVEIEKAILGRGETPIDGIEYCNGWKDFAGMGVSVVCTYDTDTHLSRCFLKEDLGDLAVYLYGKPTAGFNTKRFDLPLLHEFGVDLNPEQSHYDILEEIWIALGLNPDKFYYKTHGGWGLDAVCQATLGIKKTGHGALAPVWWQQGKRGKVIDYCLNDVHMEGSLLLHIIEHGLVDNGSTSMGVQVRRPVRYMDVNNIVGGPNEAALATERAGWREEAERRAADILRSFPEEQGAAPERAPGGLGLAGTVEHTTEGVRVTYPAGLGIIK